MSRLLQISVIGGCAVGSLADQLRPAVTVIVPYLKLGVVGPGADVQSKVYAPHQPGIPGGNVDVVGIQKGGSRIPVLGVVLCIVGIPFHHQLQLSVPVQIPYGHIIGRIMGDTGIRHHLRLRHFQHKLLILGLPGQSFLPL